HVADQRQLRKKFVHILKLPGKDCELIQIFAAKFVVRDVRFGIIVIDRFAARRIISDGILGCPAGAISSRVCASCSHAFLDFTGTFMTRRRSPKLYGACSTPAVRAVADSFSETRSTPGATTSAAHFCQRFSAVRLPMPGSNLTMRLNPTSSRGLATKRINALTSLICACSKNLTPLVI